MGTWIHRINEGEVESELIDALLLPSHLDNGWSVEKPLVGEEAAEAAEAAEMIAIDPGISPPPPAEVPIPPQADEVASFLDTETNGNELTSRDWTNGEVRAAAEKVGIEGFETKQINTLKKELRLNDA